MLNASASIYAITCLDNAREQARAAQEAQWEAERKEAEAQAKLRRAEMEKKGPRLSQHNVNDIVNNIKFSTQ